MFSSKAFEGFVVATGSASCRGTSLCHHVKEDDRGEIKLEMSMV